MSPFLWRTIAIAVRPRPCDVHVRSVGMTRMVVLGREKQRR